MYLGGSNRAKSLKEKGAKEEYIFVGILIGMILVNLSLSHSTPYNS